MMSGDDGTSSGPSVVLARGTRSKNYSPEDLDQARRFGAWLESARRKKQLTKKQVAELAGLSPAFVGQVEKGGYDARTGYLKRARRDTVVKLALALSADVNTALAAAGFEHRSLVEEPSLDVVEVRFGMTLEIVTEEGETRTLLVTGPVLQQLTTMAFLQNRSRHDPVRPHKDADGKTDCEERHLWVLGERIRV